MASIFYGLDSKVRLGILAGCVFVRSGFANSEPTIDPVLPGVPLNNGNGEVELPSPTPWLEEPVPGNFYLVMRKQSNLLTVHSFDDSKKVLKQYRAISGTNSGDKEREGDMKTPEGIYFIDRKIPQNRLRALHGAAAFELNYPNVVDRIMGRSGSGIWIHGVDNENRMKKRFDTLGCVAVSNHDVLDLSRRLTTMRNIPIVIVDAETESIPVGLEPKGGPFSEKVKAWAAAWSGRDPESYLAFYHKDFYSRGMKYEAWVRYKRRLTKQYQFIDVQLEDIKILRHGKYSVAVFKQRYRSDRFQSVSMKRLYWVGDPADAQILAEEVAQELPVVEEPLTTQL
jgi:murein L,D-transpeptidase YafK